MSEHIQLIGKKLDHLRRMQTYLEYSLEQACRVVPIESWGNLTPEQHETLAAFWPVSSLILCNRHRR